MYDVLIAGGGPGGLYAALTLARQGLRVAVVEEHDVIGEPVHCTGILADEAFDEFSLARDSVLNPLSGVRFYSPRHATIEYSMRGLDAVVVDRGRFDRSLATAAQAAGAEILRPHRVSDVTIGRDGVAMILPGRPLARARVGILACGANYGLQRRLGLGLPAVFMQSAQAELSAGRLHDVEVHIGSEVAPKGFAWAVPVVRATGPYVRVGVMCERDASGYFGRILSRVAGRWGIRADGIAQPRHKMLPLAPISKTYTDHLVVIGDAAGLVKATTGGGIYYSLVSGALAAETIASALGRNDTTASRLAAYEAAWRRRLAPELRAQLDLRLLVQRLTDREIEGLFELTRTNGVMPIVRRTARFNRHRDLILAVLKHPPVRQILLRRLAS